jgi:hypothetical protein
MAVSDGLTVQLLFCEFTAQPRNSVFIIMFYFLVHKVFGDVLKDVWKDSGQQLGH